MNNLACKHVRIFPASIRLRELIRFWIDSFSPSINVAVGVAQSGLRGWDVQSVAMYTHQLRYLCSLSGAYDIRLQLHVSRVLPNRMIWPWSTSYSAGIWKNVFLLSFFFMNSLIMASHIFPRNFPTDLFGTRLATSNEYVLWSNVLRISIVFDTLYAEPETVSWTCAKLLALPLCVSVYVEFIDGRYRYVDIVRSKLCIWCAKKCAEHHVRRTDTHTRPPLFAAFAPVLFASYWNSKNQVRGKSAQTNTGASCQNRETINIGGGETCGIHLFCSVNTFHPTECHRTGNRIVPIVSQWTTHFWQGRKSPPSFSLCLPQSLWFCFDLVRRLVFVIIVILIYSRSFWVFFTSFQWDCLHGWVCGSVSE